MLSGTALLSALILVTLNTGQAGWLEIAAGVAALGAVVAAAVYCARHPEWLIAALALIYLSLSISLFSEQSRLLVHYGGLALFCVPILLRVLRKKTLWCGDFALYSIYFLWAAITITYSLAPDFSLSRWTAAAVAFAAITGCVDQVEEPEGAQQLIFRFALATMLMVVLSAFAGLLLPHAITWQTPADSYKPEYVANLQALGIAITGMDRFRSFFNNANDVGELMLITVGLAMVCWQGASVRVRWWMAVIAGISLFAAFEADSRSPFVGIGAGVALYVVWRYRGRGLIAVAAAGVGLAVVVAASGRLVADISRGDVATLTGRTDMWAFVIEEIRRRPILGYGYEVGGAILQSRYFPIWYGPWDDGPRSSLHDGYLAHAIGVGVPATLFWLLILARPWWSLFRQKADPWNLKPLFFLVLIPSLILNLTEGSFEDFTGQVGLLCGLCWALAERYRIFSEVRAQAVERTQKQTAPPTVQAILYGR